MTHVIDADIKEKNYHSRHSSVSLLKDFNLLVEEGEKIAIVGESGVGKSSLLNILGLLDRDYSGIYRLFGMDTADLSSRDIAQWRNEKLGFVLQESALINSLTVEENIKLPLLYSSVSDAQIGLKNFDNVVEAVNIGSILHKKPYQCSGGEKSRAVFARGTIMSPRIIFSDEPTASLDAQNGSRIIDFLFDRNQNLGTTLITVTHDIDVAKMHDKTIYLERK